jgi:hypothetical protein
VHTESRREARKAFLALSGISNNEDQDKVSSQKSRVDENVAESFDDMRASGNTPVSRTSVSLCFICFSQYISCSTVCQHFSCNVSLFIFIFLRFFGMH